MYTTIQIQNPLILLLALTLMLVGCNEENSGLGPIAGSPSEGSPSSNQNVNGSTQGWVWNPSSSAYRLDMETGERTYISNNLFYPRGDGREYIELIPEYNSYSGASCTYFSATSTGIHIRDSVTLESLQFMEMRLRVFGPALLSPDGQHIAAWVKPFNECVKNDETHLQLFSRTGELIRYSYNILGFDWMPDNRLAFMVKEDGVYKLAVQEELNSLKGPVLATLPPLPGDPTRFRISPDGQQVLFEVVSGYPVALTGFSFREATVWVMNVDGSNLRKLADTSRPPTITNEAPRVNQPVWSPDSQNLLLTENYKSGFSVVTGTDINSPTLDSSEIYTVNYDYLTYIMPSNSELTLLPPTEYSPIGVRPLLWSDEQSRIQPLQMNPMGSHYWTAKVE